MAPANASQSSSSSSSTTSLICLPRKTSRRRAVPTSSSSRVLARLTTSRFFFVAPTADACSASDAAVIVTLTRDAPDVLRSPPSFCASARLLPDVGRNVTELLSVPS
eukprot:Amastigsp_a676618_39.p8 type:complete len:107 gc:universal Amastigsp_a676618_39:819-499(-)